MPCTGSHVLARKPPEPVMSAAFGPDCYKDQQHSSVLSPWSCHLPLSACQDRGVPSTKALTPPAALRLKFSQLLQTERVGGFMFTIGFGHTYAGQPRQRHRATVLEGDQGTGRLRGLCPSLPAAATRVVSAVMN